MTGRTPCSAMRLAICERNFASPLCSKQFDHRATVWRKIIDCCAFLKCRGSNIVSGVHCLVHDVNIHLLTIEFGRLIIGGCHVAKQ